MPGQPVLRVEDKAVKWPRGIHITKSHSEIWLQSSVISPKSHS